MSCQCIEYVGYKPEPNVDQWVAIYLWSCLEYIKKEYPSIYRECGAYQHVKDYTDMLNRINRETN